MRQKVFVSHPFIKNPKLNQKLVGDREKELLDDGKMPISPLALFRSFKEEHDDDFRADIMNVCYELIDMCDIINFYTCGVKLSNGQQLEYEYAKKNNKKIKFY